ncbi:PstS family phosphate ABC transporter substrate-binding protein [Chloroflexota bacterium]
MRWLSSTLDGRQVYIDKLRIAYFCLIILHLGTLYTGCSYPQPAQELKSTPRYASIPTLTVDNYPLIDGSTSTAPLGALLACQIMDVPCSWIDTFDGSRYMMPDLTDFHGDFPSLGHQGTHSSYVNLINGEADLILVARLPSNDELELASQSGINLVPRPVALDAFVFIVNKNNPVDNVSFSDLQRIYTGKLTNWKELGGEDVEIHPYQRNEQSGSQQLMNSLVMKGLNMIDAPKMVLPKMSAPFYAVSDDLLGIGYSVFYYEQNMAPNENVKLVAVDGIQPNQNSIQSLQYPFTSEVYVVVREDLSPTNPTFSLRDWLLSPEGQGLIEQSGYVPLSN